MTTTIAVNDNNDLYLGADGNVVMASDMQAVLFICQGVAQIQLGECVLQQNIGLPNFETIWNGSPKYSIWEGYLRSNLEAVEGVKRVAALTLSSQDNVLSYSATIETIYGTGVING